MRPRIAPKAAEIFVKPSAVGNVHPAAFPEDLWLHLANAPELRVWPHRVARLRRRRVYVYRAKRVDAARRIDAHHCRRLLAQLPLQGKPVLDLVWKFGIRSQLRQVRRLRWQRRSEEHTAETD